MSEMVLIADIKLVAVPDNPRMVMELIHGQEMGVMPPITAFNATDPVEDQFTITREMIQGRRFHMRDGREIVLGASKAVEEALGTPFQCLENALRELESQQRISQGLRLENTGYSLRMEEFDTASFWRRVRYAFTGKLS